MRWPEVHSITPTGRHDMVDWPGGHGLREGKLPIYEFSQTGIVALKETAFSSVNVHERRDLQRLLRENVEVIAPETLVISEEFGEWEDSRRRIDLLGIDKDANLVVIELKRTEDGGHMELQSIRYASMISTMTFDRAADVFGRYKIAAEDSTRAELEAGDSLHAVYARHGVL
jgi:RecB family endonuclease NucS